MKVNKQISNLWNSGSTYASRYENLFTYDANGNITTQLRRDLAGNTIDNLTYQYAKVGGKLHHNRLYHLNDAVTNTAFDDDIDDMGTFDDTDLTAMMFDNNYVYDEIGNLIRDEQEEIDNMIWRPDGKLEAVIRNVSSTKLKLKFDYDVSGKRVAKHVIDNNDNLLNSTYYVRDAQGNVMSVYKLNIDTILSSLSYAQKERHIYGSSMLGMDTDSLEMIGASVLDTTIFSYMVGDKRYSMSNHLGNVLAVISDKKLPVPNIDSTLVSYFKPEVFSTSDYSPFGVILDGRNFNSEKFRYSFNFQEKVSEIAPEHHTAEFWEYDPRSARRWNVDPVDIPSLSSYLCFNNNPLYNKDKNGNTWLSKSDKKEADKTANQLNKKIGNIDKQITREEKNGDTETLSQLKEDKLALTRAVESLQSMENDADKTYTFKQHYTNKTLPKGGNHNHGDAGGIVSWENKKGKNFEGKEYNYVISLNYVKINVPNSGDVLQEGQAIVKTNALKVHEIVHGGDVAKKLMIPYLSGSSTDFKLDDGVKEDEIEFWPNKAQDAYKKH